MLYLFVLLVCAVVCIVSPVRLVGCCVAYSWDDSYRRMLKREDGGPDILLDILDIHESEVIRVQISATGA